MSAERSNQPFQPFKQDDIASTLIARFNTWLAQPTGPPLATHPTVSGVGSGRLQVRQGKTWADLIRYSNALATRFHKISRQLHNAVKAELVDHELFMLGNTETLDPPCCETCQLRLPENVDPVSGSYPRCMQRGRILQRLYELIAPYRNGSIVLCLLTIFGVGAELVPPKLQQYMVDHILTNNGQPATVASAVTDFRTALLVA